MLYKDWQPGQNLPPSEQFLEMLRKDEKNPFSMKETGSFVMLIVAVCVVFLAIAGYKYFRS